MRKACNRHQSSTAVFSLCSLAAAMSLAMLTSSAEAVDARSIALGGSAVAFGIGVNGAIENPASLAAMKRRGDTAHFLLGTAADVRDHGDLINVLRDDGNRDLVDDLEAEINTVSGSNVTPECSGVAVLTASDDTPCVTGTARLAGLANDAIGLLDDIDDTPASGLSEAHAGLAVTTTTLPFAIHFGARATGRGVANVDDGDRQYVADFTAIAGDDQITLGEVRNNDRFQIENGELNIEQPEDVLSSSGEGSAMVRAQFGVSLAMSVEIAGTTLDLGVTPKFSRLTAYGLQPNLSEVFDDTSEPFEDQFDDSKVEESSFTFDMGASTQLTNLPLRLSAVLRNVVPESIKTTTDIEFETTPQLIIGALHQRERLSLIASVAINNAELDGIDTQPIALGIEYGTDTFALRGGLSTDFGRDDDVAAVSAGVKLGPLEVGARLAGINRGHIGAQLSFGF